MSCATARKGIEPPWVASKTTVLPLDDRAMGAARIELATYGLKAHCATNLRYAPERGRAVERIPARHRNTIALYRAVQLSLSIGPTKKAGFLEGPGLCDGVVLRSPASLRRRPSFIASTWGAKEKGRVDRRALAARHAVGIRPVHSDHHWSFDLHSVQRRKMPGTLFRDPAPRLAKSLRF